MTLVLAGGTVITEVGYGIKVLDADVTIEGGEVTAVGSGRREGAVIDCSGCLVIPGNVCAHTHLYSALARGMPYRLEPPKNFLQILQRVWWRLDRALDDESIHLSALVGGMEAMLSGTTMLVDHHASPNAIDGSLDVIAEALQGLGVRSILAYEVSDRDGSERAVAGIAENRRFLARPVGNLTRGMVGAHASFTLSDETLAGCVEVARDAAAGVHIHVAEDAADQADSQARFGKRVVPRLADAGALSDRSLAAHCVHLDADEVPLLHDTGSMVAHNARSNMGNRVGRMAGLVNDRATTLGTDGIGADMFAESQAVFWRGREDGWLADPAWVLDMLQNGGALLGRSFKGGFDEPGPHDWIGSINPGSLADVVVLDYQPPAPVAPGTFGGHWMFGLSSRHVRDVVVDGEVVVRDRRLTKADQDEIAAKASVEAARLWERMDTIPPHPFTPQGA